MKKASIVVGLGYGDEGKGLTTDYLCSKTDKKLSPVVIRFSGGQQAGHTVILDGVKHTHSNFGAGTLRGVPTYFSEHTTFYPATIAREIKKLESKGIYNPELTLHPLAKLSTPFDVFANRECNDNLAHGTCGLGIGKTMKRNESPYKLYAVDLLNIDLLVKKMDSILNYYESMGVTGDKFKQADIEAEMMDFMDAVMSLKWNVQDYSYLRNFDHLVFEGSQGILLDMDHGVFPNVTYSNTTTKNAHEILDKLKVFKRDIYYITRAYHSRHGAGFFQETDLKLINNEEETNVNNKYQGEFKISDLDYSLVNQALHIDNIYTGSVFSKNLVVTCLDQLEDFDFDYDELDYKFDKIIESRSPESKNYEEVLGFAKF